MEIKLSCTANMVPGESLTEKAHLLRKLGYDGMAIFVDAPDWKDELLDEMLSLEEKTGIIKRFKAMQPHVQAICDSVDALLASPTLLTYPDPKLEQAIRLIKAEAEALKE